MPNCQILIFFVPADSVFGRTTSDTDPEYNSLLRLMRPYRNFKYEYTEDFTHFNVGTSEFSLEQNENFRKAIINGLTDWATGRHVYGEQSEITDDSPYIEWVNYTVEVEYNVLDPEQHNKNCTLPESDCCATNPEYCNSNNGDSRIVREIDRVAVVVYAKDEDGNWHIAEGAATDGSRILTDARPIRGNSRDPDKGFEVFDYDITFTEDQKIVGTTYILLKLEPGDNTAPPTPEGEGFGGLLDPPEAP